VDEMGTPKRKHNSTSSREIGHPDLMFLAYHAMKREAAGKTVKPFEVWCETVTDISMGESENPKATSREA